MKPLKIKFPWFLLLLIFVCGACNKPKKNIVTLDKKADQAYKEYIAAYTSGIVSSQTVISLQLANEIDATTINTIDPNDLLSFYPGIRGEAIWVTDRLLEFTPDQSLKSGQSYVAKLDLDEIITGTDEAPSIFEFGFRVIDQNYDLVIDGLVSDDSDQMRKQVVRGRLITADVADTLQVKKALGFWQEEKGLDINWEYDLAEGVSHHFEVKGVERKESVSKVRYKVDGNAFNVSRDMQGEVEVPVFGDFKVIRTSVVNREEPYVLVGFSDPLKENQDLAGLITIEGERNLRFLIEGNEVKVFTSREAAGVRKLNVFPGIRNRIDYQMRRGFTGSISFEQVKPAVRLVGNGTILPGTDGLVFPFEAVNLKAVDVTVIKIYEKNVFQFLQTNRLSGNEQLRRVGKPIARKRLSLENSGVFDLGKWNRFTLDLADLVTTEPGAIYQVRLGFRQAYSLFRCSGEPANELLQDDEIPVDDWASSDVGNHRSYDSYNEYNYYYDGYRWHDRDNPCAFSYYVSRGQRVSRNVLASDLGLIAKIGNDRRLTAFVTDLKTTAPLTDVSIEVYDYQQELLETLKTNAEGKVTLDLARKPFLLVASRGLEKGYLKLDDGSSLSMSNFNVVGVNVKRGIKGFIYGERGVWRPGDNIYLNFILEDEDNHLPEDHPVIFELLDPSGFVKDRIVATNSMDGVYSFPTKTDADAPTGNWLAKVHVGGQDFQKKIKIETIKPNRLKIDLDFGRDKITKGDRILNGDLYVKWLTGVPGKNLEAEFELYLNPVKTTFKKFPNYSFDDRAKDFYAGSEVIYKGKTDQQGHAAFKATLNRQANAPGRLMATFSGKVYEPGGDFSIDQFSIPFYPYDHFVGVKMPEGDKNGLLVTGKDHQLDVVTVDTEGELVSKNDLKLEVYKLDWRWWWDRSTDNISNYVGRSYRRPIVSERFSTTNGKGSVEINIPDRSWGRYYIRVLDPQSGHSSGTIAYFDWPGWAEDNNRPGGASLLSFSTDKENYNIGEKVEVSIPGGTGGRALVSVENGSKVITSYWVETKGEQTSFEFETTAEMVPNVYVHTTLLQPHAQTKNDLPMRLYGVVPVNVSDPATKLKPALTMPEVFEPEAEAVITVSEQQGRPMTYTLAVVDEGLLDITRFETPDPWNTFYAREALGVKTWDLFDDVSGAFDGDLMRLLALGGDGSGAKPESAKANRFKPVVKFMGPFRLQAGQSARHTYQMPNYIGSVRTMIVAGKDGAYGSSEEATPVRKPLMVLGTLPRVIGPGETVKLPVNVFALEQHVKDVEIKVKGDAFLKVKGASSQVIRFNETGDQIIDFELEVAENLGVGKVQITASSGREKAIYEVEIDVRNPNPVVTDVIATTIKAGESWEKSFEQMGMAGTNTAQLELSVIPPINLGKRLDYLMRYPHGCIEQTTSAAFPQLFLSDIMDLDEDKKGVIEGNIKAAIDRIGSFQTGEGGFAYWPGQSDDNDWGTNYAGHFLLEARDKGYNIPSGLFKRWKSYQSKRARKWMRAGGNYNDDLMQAYRLYTLALAQTPEVGAMNRLREDASLSLEAKWRLAAAYALIGRVNAAKELISKESKQARQKNRYYYYGSRVRDNAMILEALGIMKMYEEGLDLLRGIADDLNQDGWMSTQTTAYALLSVIKFSGIDQTSKGLNATYALNGSSNKDIESARPLKLLEIPVNGTTPGSVKVENKGQGVLFARIMKSGQPLTSKEEPAVNGLGIDIDYVDRNGNDIDYTDLEQGTNFYVEISIWNHGTKGVYKDLALTQVFPSGWEILNDRLNEIPGSYQTKNFAYKDIRDDRIHTYFDLNSGERKTFKVSLNATYAGEYYLPAVKVEAMYDHTINARTAGEWVEVEREE